MQSKQYYSNASSMSAMRGDSTTRPMIGKIRPPDDGTD
jgi:hypothetical protein